jgi:HEAT repeat protein
VVSIKGSASVSDMRTRQASATLMGTKALKAIGEPYAEKAVLPLLKEANQFNRADLCRLLADIGGRDSIAPLEGLANDNSVFYSASAKEALAAVKARVEAEKK